MATLFGMFPFLKTLFADSGYQGPKFAKALAKVLPHLDIEIVKPSDQVTGFVVLPKRCVAQSLPKARQGLGESQPKGARVLAPRLNPPHAQKTMQSSLKSPDGLLGSYTLSPDRTLPVAIRTRGLAAKSHRRAAPDLRLPRFRGPRRQGPVSALRYRRTVIGRDRMVYSKIRDTI
jgi:hypothetical protein